MSLNSKQATQILIHIKCIPYVGINCFKYKCYVYNNQE